jgi:hypothetical protein
MGHLPRNQANARRAIGIYNNANMIGNDERHCPNLRFVGRHCCIWRQVILFKGDRDEKQGAK